MKTSKRSLITAIAVLCVCALSLSAASFAWFSASTTAKVTDITLNVEKASDLQISLNGKDWGYTMAANLTESVNDVSTANATTFVEPAKREEVGFDGKLSAANSGYATADAGWIDQVVYFKSAKKEGASVDIKMSGAAFDATKTIASGMRVASIDMVNSGVVFFANTAGTDDDVIADTNGTVGSVTLNGIAAGTKIITLGSETIDGIQDQDTETYVYGKITVRYWLEGTDGNVINDNSGVSFDHNLTFSIL